MNRLGIIYKATSPSGKVYIGQTIQTLSKRKSGHLYGAFYKANKRGYNTKFYRAIRKYGKDNFTWSIVYDNIPYKKLSKLEVETIAKYKSYELGYNSTKGDKREISDKTIAKLSRAGLGRPCSEETREKISRANKGRILSRQTLERMSRAQSGENNCASKLNLEKVDEIRKLHNQGKSGVYLATKYNVSPTAISRIILNKTWKS